jgi:hypothetical protein
MLVTAASTNATVARKAAHFSRALRAQSYPAAQD